MVGKMALPVTVFFVTIGGVRRMSFIGLTVLASTVVIQLAGQTAKTTEKKSQPAEVAPVESPEHAFARANYESLKQQFLDSKKEYEERLSSVTYNGVVRCKATPVVHPVTMRSIDAHMFDCRYEVKRARYVMEKLGEDLEQYAFRLDNSDGCVKTYQDTIDKKLSDQTTREVQNIKLCQASQLYPPRIK
jgi:hypothetical protein